MREKEQVMKADMAAKIARLSLGLQEKIKTEQRDYTPVPTSPVSNYLVHTKRHCNGGRTTDAGLWLKKHCDEGGQIFLTMAGAGSSFEMGVVISKLIRAGKVAGISVTGANLEESFYRLIADEYYINIPEYEKLTRSEEKEFDRAEIRRITDTILPEEESVRQLLEKFEMLWREVDETGKPRFWHEFFFEFFERNLLPFESFKKLDECWLYWAWKHGVEIAVPGVEDSTMGNIFAYYANKTPHPDIAKYAEKKPISIGAVLHSFSYTQRLSSWYLDATKERGLAFVQLGGGIAGDFPVCMVPHLKKDYLYELSVEEQDGFVRPWAAFVEIYTSPMSVGSYSGAGGSEKITWSKLESDAFMMQIFGDYTEHFPDIVALILGL